MKEIVKICKKHGELTKEQVKVESNKNGYIQIRCHQCKIEKDRKWKSNNREKHNKSASKARNEARRLYREGLVDVEPKANIWTREDRKKYPEKHKEYAKNHENKYGKEYTVTRDILSYYKISLEEYYKLFETHNNLCAICNKPETKKSRTKGSICRLGIDHCHKCEEKEIKGIENIRGLLCHACNTAIGNFKDNVELLKKAIEYLEKHKCK